MEDFTEDAYRHLLIRAKQRFAFGRLQDLGEERGVAVWRHDVDISPQRALAIAKIDQSLGVVSYFFVQLTSSFYSVLEPHVLSTLRALGSLGHVIGLHFDPSSAKDASPRSQVERLAWESRVLGDLLEARVSTFSIHNPTVSDSDLLRYREVEGMTNASWEGWHRLAQYCSDSNGYWRFENAHDLIADPIVKSLYLLTHPEWWLPERGTPYSSVLRAVDGRRSTTLDRYVSLLARHGREIKGLSGA